MPNRIIKESICTSDNIDQLSAFQETMFYRLIVTCDDYGRMDARPKILAARLFPLKDIRVTQIEDALRALTSAELVTLYTVDGKPFLQMNTWNKHQRVRDSKEKYPSIESADIRGELPQVAASCGLNPIQSNPNPNPNPNPKNAHAHEAFDTFWAAYPRKTNKQAAEKAFLKLNPDETLMQTILNAIEKQKKSDQWTKDGGQYIPHPGTWLNGRRWDDEMPTGHGKTVSAQQYNQRDYTEEDLDSATAALINEAIAGRGA